jgi:hypothetical protein
MLQHFTNISYGDVANFDVLVDVESKSLYVTQPTIERILNYRPNRGREKIASKSFKAFAGKGLEVAKNCKVIDINGKVNHAKAIPYQTLSLLVLWELSQGNQRAIDLAIAGFNDSFKSLVLEQCGIRLDIGSRLEELSEYLTGYHKMHDWVRDEYVKLTGKKPEGYEYARMNQRINQMLFGVNDFKSDRIKNANNRQIRELESAQRVTYRALSKGRLSDITNPIQRVLTFIEQNLDALKP